MSWDRERLKDAMRREVLGARVVRPPWPVSWMSWLYGGKRREREIIRVLKGGWLTIARVRLIGKLGVKR